MSAPVTALNMDDPYMEKVHQRLAWMRRQQVWPNGLRYLWTDAFGVVLLVSLFRRTGDGHWLEEARWVVDEVDRVLGRKRGVRIGEESDRDGQYFHYLAMWLFALARLGDVDERYRRKGIQLARDIHEPFVVRGTGVHWKMKDNLSGPYPGYGFGALDPFDGYVAYRLLSEEELAPQIADMEDLVKRTYEDLTITQDLGLGMMLWLSHFFPEERWAQLHQDRSLQTLDHMWQTPGYFCREPHLPHVKFAFTNYGVSVGLQALGVMPERVETLNRFFETYRSGDEYDVNAITHVMACSSYFPGALLSRWE